MHKEMKHKIYNTMNTKKRNINKFDTKNKEYIMFLSFFIEIFINTYNVNNKLLNIALSSSSELQ